MNVATENNNELGISLFLWGVRGGGDLYRVDRRALFAALRWMSLCRSGCVPLAVCLYQVSVSLASI